MSRCMECIRLACASTTAEPHAGLVEELPRARELHVQTFTCRTCGPRRRCDVSLPSKYRTPP